MYEIHAANHEFTLQTIETVQTLAPRRNLSSAPEGASRLRPDQRLELEEIGGKQIPLDSIFNKGWIWNRYSDGVSIVDGELVNPISRVNERPALQYFINKATFADWWWSQQSFDEEYRFITFRDSALLGFTVVTIDFRYSPWPIGNSVATCTVFRTMEVPDLWRTEYDLCHTRWMNPELETPRVALSLGIDGDMSRGTVLVDPRLFVQHPQIVLSGLGISHGDKVETLAASTRITSSTG